MRIYVGLIAGSCGIRESSGVPSCAKTRAGMQSRAPNAIRLVRRSVAHPVATDNEEDSIGSAHGRIRAMKRILSGVLTGEYVPRHVSGRREHCR